MSLYCGSYRRHRILMRFVLTLLGVLALNQLATSQQEVVGLTGVNSMLISQSTGSGACTVYDCNTNFAAQTGARGGGAAYDSRIGAVWVTNGTQLDAVTTPRPSNAICVPTCSTQRVPMPGVAFGDYCTGLTYLDGGAVSPDGTPAARGRLYFLYESNRLGWALTQGCDLSNYSFCDLSRTLPVNATISGLACDDVRRLLFVGINGTPARLPRVNIYDADDPCTLLCSVEITTALQFCSTELGEITGLTYDSCEQTLFVTDGNRTLSGSLQVVEVGGNWLCTWQHESCCPLPPSDPLTGLALTGIAPVSVGQSCTLAPCFSCPTMQARTTGDPVLGNGAFSLDLINAPSNAGLAILALAFGSCTTPGVNVGLCQQIRVPSAGQVLAAFVPPPNTPGSCGTVIRIPVPIPVDPVFCGTALSFQWGVSCTNASRDTSSISNCVSLVVRSL